MDVSVALRSVENLFRDTLQHVLSNSLGEDWEDKCGVSPQRIAIWRDRAEEDKRRNGRSDPRLIYYSDFYDLSVIVRKSWEKGLSDIFEDLKETVVLLGILEDLRNPEAHRREFLPFETELASGIAGKMRARVTKYFSERETSESYYPRIEFAQDSLGNSFKIGGAKLVRVAMPLRIGAQLQFKVVASDPLGEAVEYCVYPNVMNPVPIEWNATGEFSFEIDEHCVGSSLLFVAAVRSPRPHRATLDVRLGRVDDTLMFEYVVHPPRRER